MDNKLNSHVRQIFQPISGVESAYINYPKIIIVAKGLHDIDWEALIFAEDILLESYPSAQVSVHASQGRNSLPSLSAYTKVF